MSQLFDEHRAYLADEARIDAFRRAVAEVVRPGDVVIDLGAGTGILGLLACERGAARVYAIDSGPIIDVARRLAAANGFGDRIVPVADVSTRAEIPERASVILTDQIGHFGIEAGVIEYVRDAARRWLEPGGRIVPHRIELFVAPVEHAELRARVEFWRGRTAGFDLSPVYRQACNTGYPFAIDPSGLLADASLLTTIVPGAEAPEYYHATAEITIARSGRLDAIGGWFRAWLSPSVEMTNRPGDARRIGRRQVLLPLTPPVDVQVHDRLQVTITMRPADLLVGWVVDVFDPAGQRRAWFRHSTLEGMIIAPDVLRRTGPGFVPELTPAGRARQSVLELCDGHRSVAEIEREMRSRHPELLRDDAAAAVFVAEVLSVYAR